MSYLFSNFCSNSLRTKRCTAHVARHLKGNFFPTSRAFGRLGSRCTNQALREEVAADSEKFTPFQEVMKNRRTEAKRSILVQVQSAQSYKELHSYCSSLGTVKKMFHYSAGVEPMHFIIVEFADESDVKNVLTSSSYIEDTQVVPVRSQFLWFRAPGRKLSKLKQSSVAILNEENGTDAPNDNDIRALLRSAENISEQMRRLHEETRLNDVGTRLRFLAARQVEDAVSGMFPEAAAYPFGSSVNGCGKMGCDLDLVLRLNDEKTEETRLVFHSKAASGSERSTSQRHMETIGDMIQLFLPGCAQVRRILQARVPIIKYYQQFADVECDLSLSNMSGVHMSDLLYIMGSIDPRVRPLVFTIRKWAHEVGLTNSSPGRWMTNFSLTLLVLAFLQNKSTAILPSLNSLIKQAGPEDNFVTEEGINCTFLRDISKLNNGGNLNVDNLNAKNLNTNNLNTNNLNTNNSNTNSSNATSPNSLSKLLLEFFEYYSLFDFNAKAVCLNENVPITKPEHCALYIVNPLERGLNVSKNVSLEELERFRIEIREAAWILESQEKKSHNWGLLTLFDHKRTDNVNRFYVSLPHRKMFKVSTLFEKDESSVQEGGVDSSNAHGNTLQLNSRELNNLELTNPGINNPGLSNPEINTPGLNNPGINNSELNNPELNNPELNNPEFNNPELNNTELNTFRLNNPELNNPDLNNSKLNNVLLNIKKFNNLNSDKVQPSKAQTIEFKDAKVKKQVEKIKKDTNDSIQSLENGKKGATSLKKRKSKR